MFSAQRMKVIGIFAAAYIAVVAVLAALFPMQGSDYWGTFLVWLVCLPIFAVIGFSANWVAALWKRMSGVGRGVLVLGFAAVAALVVALLIAFVP